MEDADIEREYGIIETGMKAVLDTRHNDPEARAQALQYWKAMLAQLRQVCPHSARTRRSVLATYAICQCCGARLDDRRRDLGGDR